MKHLNTGTIIEYKIANGIWVESVIYKISDSFVWFKGSGFSRIAKKTFEKYPSLYRIK
jgi:hypothetical protein